MAKDKRPKEVVSEVFSEDDPFWIYPGERRPVVVQAKNERHAKHKVTESSEYDGFPVYVFPVEKFASRCQPKGGGTKLEDTPEEKRQAEAKKRPRELFVMAKAVEGKVVQAVGFATRERAVEEADSLAKHLSHGKDDLRVFKFDADFVPGSDFVQNASEVHRASLVGAPVTKAE